MKHVYAKIIFCIVLALIFLPVLSLTSHAQTTYKAILSGSHEVPPVTTTATGEVTAVLDGNTLTVEGTFSNLSSPVATEIGGGAHIHMEWPGRNGGVIFPLELALEESNTGGSIIGDNNQFELDESQIEALESRMLYVNIHSENFMPGEIRGQLLPEADDYFRVNLSGTNEVPPVLSMANGAITGELDGNSLAITGSFQGLGSDLTGAHIHMHIAGRNAGVVFPLTVEAGDDNRSGTFSAADNTFELDAEHMDALLERGFYINIHSNTNPGGEIRGQIVPQASTSMVANISGSAEAPGVISAASGSIIVELDGNTLTLTGSFQNLGSNYTNSHLHVSLPGRSGGVSVPLQPTIDPEDMTAGIYEAENNTYELDEDQIARLMNRELYINIHSQNFPAGEIRGQLLGESYAFFTATFAGINEVPPVISSGTGGVEIEFKGSRLVMAGAFDGLTSNYTAAHFHTGAPHESGGVILGVQPTLGENDTSGVFQIANNHYLLENDDDFITQLFDETLYLNVHSSTYPPGELRGQVLRAPNAYPGTSEIEMPEDEAIIAIEGDGGQHFDVAWSSADDPDGNLVVYIWQVALDEDFTELVFMGNSGTENQIEISFAEADEFLEEQEVEAGESLTLYHRVVVSDGSLHRISEASSFTLDRGIVTSLDPDAELPLVTRLDQNYPNPFNPSTEINFTIAESGPVELTVYNITGQRVAVLMQNQLSPGEYNVRFNASGLASGIYMYRLSAAGQVMTRKMILVK